MNAIEAAIQQLKSLVLPDLLETIRNKGCCIYTINKAHKALSLVKNLIEETEYTKLSIALNHMEIGEGPEELFEVISLLKTKYYPDQQ